MDPSELNIPGMRPPAPHDDENMRAILHFALWMVVAAVVIYAALWGMFKYFDWQAALADPAQNPLLVGEKPPATPAARFPQPRLQANAAADLVKLQATEEEKLDTYGWVDRNAGITRMPIEQAMRLVAEHGVRVARPAAATATDFGEKDPGEKEVNVKALFRCASILLLASDGGGASAQAQKQAAEAPAVDTRPPLLQKVGIDQKLDQPLPLEAAFRDEAGNSVTLGHDFGRRPVILALVYYNCPMLCTQVLEGLARDLKPLSFNPGKEFDVVAVSFDARETPAQAAAKKQAILERYGRPGTEAGWHFLTGEQASIDALTRAAGFRYAWDPQSNPVRPRRRHHDRHSRRQDRAVLLPGIEYPRERPAPRPGGGLEEQDRQPDRQVYPLLRKRFMTRRPDATATWYRLHARAGLGHAAPRPGRVHRAHAATATRALARRGGTR